MLTQRKTSVHRTSRSQKPLQPLPTEFDTMEGLKKAFPRSFPKNGSVNLKDRKSLVRLPVDFRAVGTLTVSGCSRLEQLPASRDNIYLVQADGCTNLRTLDHRYKLFDGFLDLTGCTSLEYLPEGMRVVGSGSLILKGCTALKALPHGLEVDGKLDITGCSGLSELPEELKAGVLDMEGCKNIRYIPDSLSAMVINLKGCDGIHIPQSFCERMEKTSGIVYPESYEVIPSGPTQEGPMLR